MDWRNDQLYHLRQSEKLTISKQDSYFKEILLPQKNNDQPEQILFSFFYKSEFVGYGGLVYLDWVDKSSEVSFVMDTTLEKFFFFRILECFFKPFRNGYKGYKLFK